MSLPECEENLLQLRRMQENTSDVHAIEGYTQHLEKLQQRTMELLLKSKKGLL